jgi:hypothetical protein
LWKRDDAIAGSRPSSDVSKRGLELETPLAGSVVVVTVFLGCAPAYLGKPGTLGLGMAISNVPQALPQALPQRDADGRAVLRFAKGPP